MSAARFTRALRDWAGDGPRAAVRGRGRGDLPRATARGSRRAGPGGRGAVRAAARSTRCATAARRRWGGRRSSSTASTTSTGSSSTRSRRCRRHCDADVTVSLPYERGRLAFRRSSGVHQELLAIGRRRAGAAAPRRPLRGRVARGAPPPRAQAVRGRDRRGRGSCPAPSRSTPPAASAPRSSWPPPRCSSCCATGVTPGDVAVVFRDPTAYASLLEQVFGAYGIPYSIDRTLPFGHTGLGRGLLALIRAAGAGGHGRRPARLPAHARPAAPMPGFADTPRGRGAPRGRATPPPTPARAGSATGWPLDELDRLARARDTAAFAAELESRLATLFAGPVPAHRAPSSAARSSRRRARSPRPRRRSPSCARCWARGPPTPRSCCA